MRRRFVGARRLLFRDAQRRDSPRPMRTTPWSHPPRGGHSARPAMSPWSGLRVQTLCPGLRRSDSHRRVGSPCRSTGRRWTTAAPGRVDGGSAQQSAAAGCAAESTSATHQAGTALPGSRGCGQCECKIRPPAGPGKRWPSNRPHKNRHRQGWPLTIRCPWRRPFPRSRPA